MIMSSDEELPIGLTGKAYVTDKHREYHIVHICVLREATFEEYIKFCESEGIDSSTLIRHPFHYEVSMD